MLGLNTDVIDLGNLGIIRPFVRPSIFSFIRFREKAAIKIWIVDYRRISDTRF